ncbi:hypothetical protein [Maridesulfovibrio sp.]|uniref:hypothetical protein n=1 Tax=Maridesulfovibrio sp. TaxID=2795000 RepID=UPI002A187962|nr:hypothetical protein [Maridesulfovibrio sp.]
MHIKFSTFPRTQAPPPFLEKIVNIFRAHEDKISTTKLDKNLVSNDVLKIICKDLEGIGFEVENGKKKNQKVKRPVFYGENAEPSLQYEIDAYHAKWNVGLEVEAARALGGNALYRDIVQALVLVDLKYLIVAVPNEYRYGAKSITRDYNKAVAIAEALYGHSRIVMPYCLTIVGY